MTGEAGATAGSPRESAARSRTRAAILAAAVELFSENRNASMTELAAAARVGRSTLHRYFPERADVIRAVARLAIEETATASRQVGSGGTPLEALRRVVEAYLEFGPVMLWLASEPAILNDPPLMQHMYENVKMFDDVLVGATEQLHPHLSRSWVRRVLMGLIYVGWEAERDGEMTRHEVCTAVMTTVTDGVIRMHQRT
ncbi:TetR/AcrR family transcriptional regulator [Streptomyces sp. NPDC059255]|uniref:TetR/AcrR family transcriptional regulator n=1 Tax=Streptomyces sp. NPDC059255 TaxID=3346793 RepID=UPI0036B47A01